MPDKDEPSFELIAMKGKLSGTFCLWYGTGESDRSPFVLTLTPDYVANALGKKQPISLEEIVAYAKKNARRLKAIARSARERGGNAKVLD